MSQTCFGLGDMLCLLLWPYKRGSQISMSGVHRQGAEAELLKTKNRHLSCKTAAGPIFLSFCSFSFVFVLLKFLKTCCNRLSTSNDFCASEDVLKILQRHRSLLLYEAGVFEISVKYWLVLGCNRFLFPKNFIGHHAIQSVRLLPWQSWRARWIGQ